MPSKRPQLRKGDLVKRKKPNDDGKMYRVMRMESPPRRELRKLGMIGRSISSSEGFVLVWVKGLDGALQCFKRRELWRVPNQPRDRKHKKYDPPSYDHNSYTRSKKKSKPISSRGLGAGLGDTLRDKYLRLESMLSSKSNEFYNKEIRNIDKIISKNHYR